MKNNYQITRSLGYLGLLASVLVGIGEFYLHYSPEVLISKEPFEFFKDVPNSHLTIGHFLIVTGLPFYFAGYIHIYRMLRSGDERMARIVLALGFIAFAVGGIWIGSRYMIGSIVQLQINMPDLTYQILLKKYSSHYEILVNILRIVIALLSLSFAYTILKFKTHYPKWMALFNLIFVLITLVAIGFMMPVIGKFTLPILMNITHMVLFSFSVIVSKRNINENKQ